MVARRKKADHGRVRRKPPPALAWRVVRWSIGLFLAALLGLQAYFWGSVTLLRWKNPASTAFISTERERLQQVSPSTAIRWNWVAYGAISTSVKRAVIASEDAGFSQHDGIDWEAMEKAARENLRKGKIRKGGSTITMQLAKNLYLSSDRSYLRKAQEVVIAGMLELMLDKKRILELYLNVAEWGVGVFGIEAAARHYFGVSAAELDEGQAAWLAAILPAPKRFDRNRESDWISEKTFIILERMTQVALPR